jgi:hypothetical protein
MSLSNDLLCLCDLSSDGETLFVRPNRDPEFISQNLVRFASTQIQNELHDRHLKRAEIVKGWGKPYQILAAPAVPTFSESGLRAIGASDPILTRSLEPIAEAAQQGKIVTIVSMITNLCKHSNDLLTPARSLRHAPDWTGYNYLSSWRLNGKDPSPEYFKLIGLLYDNWSVKGYEYSLIRPDDGAVIRYSTDYTMAPFLGKELVRIGVSRPEDFTILEKGRGDRIIRN